MISIIETYTCEFKFIQNILITFRARKEYWEGLKPATGRPTSASMSNPDAWGVTQGSEDLKQHAEVTTKEELEKVFSKKMTGISCATTGKAM